MIDRSDLEISRKFQEMDELCQYVVNDIEAFSDLDFQKRRGVIKDILEEYYPLSQLVKYLGEEYSGKLTRKSHAGPDAIVSNSHFEYTIQITCGNQSYKEALNREMLLQEFIMFPDQEKERDKIAKKIIGRGRAFTTREGKLGDQVREVENALKKKLGNFYEGTDILLVDTEIGLADTNLEYSWQNDLCERISKLQDIPYKQIFIVHKYGVYSAGNCITMA